MMKRRNVMGAAVAAVLLLGGMALAASIQSGLQVGDSLSPFDVLNCNGPNAGTTNCQV
jgi:hypothetical protein